MALSTRPSARLTRPAAARSPAPAGASALAAALAPVLLVLLGARGAGAAPTLTHGWDTALESQFIDYGYSVLTAAQAANVAAHYAVASLEKCTGPGPTEANVWATAAQLKAIKPSMKVLFYWDLDQVALTCYAAHDEYMRHPEWWLRDDAAQLTFNSTDGVPHIDYGVAAARDWWVSVPLNGSGSPAAHLIDGVLADGTGSRCPASSAGGAGLSPARCNALIAAKSVMVRQLQALLDATNGGSVIGNGLDMYPGGPPDQNMYTLADMDGIMGEHFAVFESVLANGTLDVARVAQFMADVGVAAAAGKTVVVALWPGLCVTPFTSAGWPSWPGGLQPNTTDGWRAALLDKHRFALAAFLTVAEVNVWMQYEGWYGLNQGAIQCPTAPESCAAPLAWYPQLTQPLGAPLGPAVRAGNVWRREFEHASVLLDLGEPENSGVVFAATPAVAAAAATGVIPPAARAARAAVAFGPASPRAAFGVTPPPVPAGALAPHPRIVLTPARIAELLDAHARNNTADIALLFSQLAAHAEYALTQPVVAHGVPGPSGILINVRTSLDLLLTSAAAHLLLANASGAYDGRFLERATREALNLAGWPDWNTEQHALDTGEALLATGLAFDWLSNFWNESVRTAVVAGIVQNGLTPYRAFMHNSSVFWWRGNSINWNCVCSAGGAVAVLALYGDDGAPDAAWADVLQPLVSDAGVAPCVAAYNKDSSWEEGPGYWAYASKYNVWMFAALQSALGDRSAAGLTALPGVAEAARFPFWSTGSNALGQSGPGFPSELFNWADASALGEDWAPFAQWWGTDAGFGDGASSYWARLRSRTQGPTYVASPSAWAGFVEALAFFEPRGEASDLAALPTAKLFDFVNVAVFRSPLNATQQNFLSLKGGNSAWNHGHLDLGSFVFDYAGRRLAEDLGADSYDLPGYFGPQRFSYYRLNSLGHNVPIFANASQTHPVAAPITAFAATGAPASAGNVSLDGFAIVDLTAAYAVPAGIVSARRGFVSLSASAAVVVVDEFVYSNSSGATRPANLTWQLHTRAAASQLTHTEVALVPAGGFGPGANGASLVLLPPPQPSSCISAFAGFKFTDLTTVLPSPPFDSAAGLTRVDMVFGAPSPQCTSVAVALGDSSIVAALSSGAVRVRALADWETLGPLEESM
jgi:hypothetical protein